MGWREKNRPDNEVWLRVWSNHGRISYRMVNYWGGRKRKNGGMFVHIRTTQERRMWDEEHGRTKRSPRRLPNYWDEKIRDSQHTWKKHRRHQYKVIDMSTKRKVGSAC